MKTLQILSFIIILATSLAAQNLQWVKNFSGTGSESSISTTVDNQGNVYTLGTFDGTVDFDPSSNVFNLTSNGLSDIFISKLDQDGNFIWAKKIGGIGYDNGNSIAFDGNNLIIGGNFSDTVDFDPNMSIQLLSTTSYQAMYMAKFDLNGNLLWVKSLDNQSVPRLYEIKTNSNKEIFMVGLFRDSLDFDPSSNSYIVNSVTYKSSFILKLDSMGNFIQVSSYSLSSPTPSMHIEVENSGNMYLSRSAGGYPFNITVAKLDSFGNIIWENVFSTGSDVDNRQDISIDNLGNVYFTGYHSFQTTINGVNYIDRGALLIKFDSLGNYIWAKNFNGYVNGLHIEVDKNGEIVTLGEFGGNVNFTLNDSLNSNSGPTYLNKYDTNENLLWMKQLNAYVNSLFIDANNLIYLSGYYNANPDFDPNSTLFSLSNSGNEDAFVLKLDNNPVGIDRKSISLNSISVFPNPSTETISIKSITSISNPKIEIYNILGIKVLETQSIHKIDISQLQNGVYFLKIYDNEKFTNVKFVKE